MNNTRKRGASAGLLAGSGLLALGLLAGLFVPATAAAQQTTPVPAQTSKTTAPATTTTTPLRNNITATTVPATTTVVPTTTAPATTALPTTAVPTTPAQNCDPKRDLSGSVAGGQGTLSNRSANCSYRVGLASYMRFDEVIDHQKFYRGVSDEIKPAQTLTLSAGLPDCSAQIDLFFGDLLTSLDGQRYSTRLLAWANTGGPFCVVSPETTAPATTAVPTTPPVTTAAPTTALPTTAAPTTVAPTTSAPVTTAPATTILPTTSAPVTTAPVTTSAPTTSAPATAAPATSTPATAAPATAAPITSTATSPVTTAGASSSPATTVAGGNAGIVPTVEGVSAGPEENQSGTPAPVVLGESQAPIIPTAMPATGAGGTAAPDLKTYLLFGAIGLFLLTSLGLIVLRKKEM